MYTVASQNRIRNIAEDYGIDACSKPVVKNYAFDIEETERTISKSEGMLYYYPIIYTHCSELEWYKDKSQFLNAIIGNIN